MGQTLWSPDRTACLIELLDQPLSAGKIAAELTYRFRVPVSRNAVISKVMRLHRRLPGQRGPWKPQQIESFPTTTRHSRLKPGRRPRPPQPRWSKPTLTEITLEPIGIPLLDLEPSQCSWPIGIGYCGHPRLKGSSYCPNHHVLAHQPHKRTAAYYFRESKHGWR